MFSEFSCLVEKVIAAILWSCNDCTSAHSSYPKIVPVPSLYVCLPSSSFIFICFCHLLGSLLLGFILLSVLDASVVLFLSFGHLLGIAWLPAPQSHPFLALDGSGQPWQLWANHPKVGRALRQGQSWPSTSKSIQIYLSISFAIAIAIFCYSTIHLLGPTSQTCTGASFGRWKCLV